MEDEVLAQACAPYRDAEVKETALLVVQDKDLQRMLAVWPLVERRVVVDPYMAAEGGWAMLWTAVEVDEKGLWELCGLPTGRAPAAFARAKALRLIYPDGSVHHYGKMVVQKLIKDALTGGAK